MTNVERIIYLIVAILFLIFAIYIIILASIILFKGKTSGDLNFLIVNTSPGALYTGLICGIIIILTAITGLILGLIYQKQDNSNYVPIVIVYSLFLIFGIYVTIVVSLILSKSKTTIDLNFLKFTVSGESAITTLVLAIVGVIIAIGLLIFLYYNWSS